MHTCDQDVCDTDIVSSPTPWIGVYVAAASLVCSLAMAADAFQGFRQKKLWFPCKFFTLNATSLTALSIAMKLPVDLTNPMRGKMDQLAKLGSTVFLSTIIANFMPSIGAIDGKAVLTNITALGILVITMVVNVCIQIGTGVIFALRAEQSLIMFLILVLLVLLSSSALAVPTTKMYLEFMYGEVHKTASDEESEDPGKFRVKKLKEEVKKHCIMAETVNPQFVMARSATCSASGAICFMTSLVLVEAAVQVHLLGSYASEINSDYKWSSYLIFGIQSGGVVVGTLSPAFRWFTAIRLQYAMRKGKNHKSEFKAENYWIQKLVEWKESPLPLKIRGQKSRKLVHITKTIILNFCIRVQIVIVVASKLVLLFSVSFVTQFLQCCQCCTRLGKKANSIAVHNDSRSMLQPGSKQSSYPELSRYVLHLEGEEEFALWIIMNDKDATDYLIRMGKTRKPKYLKELLKKSNSFEGVAKFESDQVPSLQFEESTNCWTLPVVTLTSIAIALPNIQKHMVDSLLRSVTEGLSYVRIVEENLNPKGELINARKTADMVWLEVDLYHKWLDKDLRKIALEGKTSRETLERLAEISKNSLMEFQTNMIGDLKNPLNWPNKVIAANSMYRVSQTLQQDCEGRDKLADERLFEHLSLVIADLLGACLTNLPRVITTKYFCSDIKEREESVQCAAHLLGETEEILEILQERELPTLAPDKAAYLDEWRASVKQAIPSDPIYSANRNTVSSASGELHITIKEDA